MFGLLGTILYGTISLISWSQDEHLEQKARQSSQKYGLPYYVDKHGKQRWTATGRKRTPEEIWQSQVDFNRRQAAQREKVFADKKKQDELDALKRFREKYELFVIHKDNLSFEEFVALHMSPIHLKYDSFKKIKESVSEERLKEIKSNHIKFG